MDNTKFLFLSKIYPQSLIDELCSHSKIGLDYAAHNLGMSIITGFKDNNEDVSIINTPQLGSFPAFYNKLIVPQYKEDNLDSIRYCNLIYLKRYFLEKSVYHKVYEWCKNNPSKRYILLYNFNYLGIVKKIKNYFPDTKFVLLVTDLPEYMSTKKNWFSSITKHLNRYQKPEASKLYDGIDGFILLAEKMSDRLPIGNKPIFIMEGIYNNEYISQISEKEDSKVIMYTGNLGKRYGILDLLEAFKLIKSPDYRLWIRGSGELEGVIRNMCQTDTRIKLLGKLSRSELSSLQSKATILVNPVKPSEEFTSFFFPSKTLEYLASGTPTLMHKLPCIPPEYNKYLYYFDNECISEIRSKIVELCEKPRYELSEWGAKAREFIFSKKNPKEQISKVIEFFYFL